MSIHQNQFLVADRQRQLLDEARDARLARVAAGAGSVDVDRRGRDQQAGRTLLDRASRPFLSMLASVHRPARVPR
jgi:hypothetical protein